MQAGDKRAPLMEYDFRKRLESALTHLFAPVASPVNAFASKPPFPRVRRRGVRVRLGLLAAAIAALALMGNGYRPPWSGVLALDLTKDGRLLALAANDEGRVWEYYISDDGGMSWSSSYRLDTRDELDTLSEFLAEQPRLFVSSQRHSVDTPRGEYAITDAGVARRSEDWRLKLVYSTEYLRGDANEWLQEYDTKRMPHRVLSERPREIIYHAESGNIIAAMGIQGVAVETPDGRWRRVAVGVHSPTDFSIPAKTRALMENAPLIGAIALALSLSALVVSAAASEYDGHKIIGAILLLAAFGSLTAIGAITGYPVVLGFIAAPVSLAATIAAVVSRTNVGARWTFALVACVSTLLPSVMLLYSMGLSNNVCRLCTDADFYRLGYAVSALTLIPPLARQAPFIARRWRPFALAFVGMVALVALSFALWLTLNVSIAAAQIAIIVLVGLAAAVLVRHIRGERRPAPLGMGESE